MNASTWTEDKQSWFWTTLVFGTAISILIAIGFFAVNTVKAEHAEVASMRIKAKEAYKTAFPGSYAGEINNISQVEFSCYKNVKEAKIALGKMTLR